MFESPPYFVFPGNPDTKFVHSECGGTDPSGDNTHGMTMRQWYKGIAMNGMLAANDDPGTTDPEEIIRRYVMGSSELADAQIAEDKAFAEKGTDE